MEQSFLDACVFTISNAPGVGGGFTFAARRSGAFLSPSQAGVVDQQLYRLFIYEPTTGDLEIRANCRWTQSTGTFSRGSLKRSTTGSPIAFTASAIVSVIDTDAKEQAARSKAVAAASADLSYWASSKVGGLRTVALAMSRGAAVDLLPPPAWVSIPDSSGPTYYVDPTWAGPFNGTFAQPYNTPSQANVVAGVRVLFKEGTTTTVSAHIYPNGSGTAENKIIYGVYDSVGGQRLIGRRAAATVICTESTGAVFIIGLNNNHVCVDGLQLQAGAVNTFGLIDANGGSHMTITNCELVGGGFAGIRAYGPGHVIQGNVIRNCAGDAVYFYQDGGIYSQATIQYNAFRDNGGNGVYAYDAAGLARFDCEFACNTVVNQGAGIVGRAALQLLNAGGVVRAYRNHISRCSQALALNNNSAATKSTAGSIFENNDIEDCGEFGVATSAIQGLLVQCNRVLRTGSFDRGVTQGVATGYGRALEFWGPDAARATRDVIVRYNFISGAYNWLTDGTEGVGIGVDDNTRDFEVYGNYVELCEGNGIQVNRGYVGKVYGNICVDNLLSPPSRGANFTGAYAGQIFYIGTPWLDVFNNTCVFTGLNTSVHQKFGVAENDVVLSRKARLFNNFIYGASVAAIAKTQNAQGTAESFNKALACPKFAVDCTSLADVAAGTSSGFVSTNDVDLDSELFAPTLGGALDGTGTPLASVARSFSGRPLATMTPIGATHPA